MQVKLKKVNTPGTAKLREVLVILKAVHGRLQVGEFDTKSAKAVF